MSSQRRKCLFDGCQIVFKAFFLIIELIILIHKYSNIYNLLNDICFVIKSLLKKILLLKNYEWFYSICKSEYVNLTTPKTKQLEFCIFACECIMKKEFCMKGFCKRWLFIKIRALSYLVEIRFVKWAFCIFP